MTLWQRILAASFAAAFLSGCGAPAAPTATPEPATAAPSVAPTVTRQAASPAPSPSPASPRPTATAVPLPANTVWVGNTEGEGVFVRQTPVMDDHLAAYPDGTPLTIVGDDVDGDGQHWKHVKTPDGLEGYVPSAYTVESPP